MATVRGKFGGSANHELRPCRFPFKLSCSLSPCYAFSFLSSIFFFSLCFVTLALPRPTLRIVLFFFPFLSFPKPASRPAYSAIRQCSGGSGVFARKVARFPPFSLTFPSTRRSLVPRRDFRWGSTLSSLFFSLPLLHHLTPLFVFFFLFF